MAWRWTGAATSMSPTVLRQRGEGDAPRLCFLQLRHARWAAASTFPLAWRWTGAATSMSPIAVTHAVKELNLATPPSLSFATTNVGSQSSDSPQTVTLRNIGNVPSHDPFPVPGTGENPSVSANFTLDASTTCPKSSHRRLRRARWRREPAAIWRWTSSPQPADRSPAPWFYTDNNLNAQLVPSRRIWSERYRDRSRADRAHASP